jgi:predicted SnoaL-like aldol condensation-catalyzing enzyme
MTADIETVLSVFQGIANRDTHAATKPMNTMKYRQHNPHASDGVNGVKEYIHALPTEKSLLKTVRAFQDGPYIFTHTVGDILGQNVFFDIFRMEKGLIVEHWVIWEGIAPPNESGHTQIDGPTEAKDFQDTEKNKSIVRSFYDVVLVPRDYHKATQYFSGDHFIRHDPIGGDGVAAFIRLLESNTQCGLVFKIDEVKFVLGQGDFVCVASRGSLSEEDPCVSFDLYRVEGGKIAEHWGVVQKIPPPEERKNDNGML